jgi:hypothetical protein
MYIKWYIFIMFIYLFADAVKAILSFSTSVEELLSRQKINKDVLFQYLVSEKVFPPVSSRRPELIIQVLKLWVSDAQV